MIVSFIPGARLLLRQPTIDPSFKIKGAPYNGPGSTRYVRVMGNQLRLAGILFIGGCIIQKDKGYIVDKSLLQIH